MTQVKQFDLFGSSTSLPPDLIASMNRDEKVAYILEHWPETRDDDRTLILRYWQEFDALEGALGSAEFARFAATFPKLTSPETIRRGRQSVQKLRTGTGSLQPSGSVADYRRARDSAGPPRR